VLGENGTRGELGRLALLFVVLAVLTRAIDLLRAVCAEILAMRFARDGCEEFYLSLLGKSQIMTPAKDTWRYRKTPMGGASSFQG
jgi:hypothetical protein